MNYKLINKNYLKDNIKLFKKNYNYKNYILNVSNKAFYHGIEIVKYLNNEFNYLYTNNFNDVTEIRKYSHDINIIYSGLINEDNIYDLILNDAILVIKDKKIMDYILSLNIKDKFGIILSIDPYNYNGFNSKTQIEDLLLDIKDKINIDILGVMAIVNEKNYLDFKTIIAPLKKLELVILNNETEKNKIKLSNAIILDKSIYGIDTSKKKLFKKVETNIKPVLQIKTNIQKIIIQINGTKEKDIAVINFGLNHGFSKNINKVFINNKLYKVIDVKDEYTLINVDNKVKANDLVEIIGINNPLNNYINDDLIVIINALTSNVKLIEE